MEPLRRVAHAVSHNVGLMLAYVAPFLTRVYLSDAPVGDMLLSTLPLMLAAPSALLPRFVPDERLEHVCRHAWYALVFTMASAIVVRWDVAASAHEAGEAWPTHLLAFILVGCCSLWWFTISHVLENRGTPIRTHHGDVVVLPLTLYTIGSFVERVPDDAFVYCRSTLFYVPLTVAWATLFLIAFTDFGSSSTTTHTHANFHFVSRAAVVVSSAHALLIESRASTVAFAAFSQAAALYAQLMHCPAHDADANLALLRAGTRSHAVLVYLLVGLATGLVLMPRFGDEVVWIALYACVALPLATSPVCRAWPLASAPLAALCSAVLLPDIGAAEAVLLWATYQVAFALASLW